MCRRSDVVVVGGGNSAGQAAVYLAGQARKVYLVVRADDLYKGMFELFTFEATGDEIRFNLPETGDKVTSHYTIESVDGPERCCRQFRACGQRAARL